MLKEVKGSIFQMMDKCLKNNSVAWIVIPTNSCVKANEGITFMPAVTKAIPWVEFKTNNGNTMRTNMRKRLAWLHKTNPKQWQNKLCPMGRYEGKLIVGLPHKLSDWRAPEDLSLIMRECQTIVDKCNKFKFKAIAMLRPVADDTVWANFLPKLEALFSKTDTVIGVFDGIADNPTLEPGEPEPPKVEPQPDPNQLSLGVDNDKSMPLKLFNQLSDEEKKARRRAAALKGAETKRNKNKAKVIEAELSSMLKELD